MGEAEIAVGERVRALRRRRGLTQQVLADLVGYSARWLISLESGEVDLKLSQLNLIAAALRVTPGELAGGSAGAETIAAVTRRMTVKQQRIERLSTHWCTRVGDVTFPWVVASYGPFGSDHIQSFFDPREPNYPDEIERAFLDIHKDSALRSAVGEEVPYDSDDFKLVRFHVSERSRGLEESKLVLHFAPTTYYRMLATDQRLDIPLTVGGRTYTLRERYAANVDLRVAPVPELATHWGVGLSVVTADGQLLISERGNTAVDPYIMFPSVAEGSTRAKDSAPGGAPDHWSTAASGVQEELGISMERDELTWLSFGANSVLCEYGLIGRLDSTFTLQEIIKRRSVGAAKDSWETRRLHGVAFEPVAVAEFCSQPGRRFSAFALIAITHALMHEYGVGKTEAAFSGRGVAVSQQLPDWVGQ